MMFIAIGVYTIPLPTMRVISVQDTYNNIVVDGPFEILTNLKSVKCSSTLNESKMNQIHK